MRRRAALTLAAAGLLVALAACDAPAAPAGKLFAAWKANDPAAATGAITTHAAKVQMFSEPYSASAQWTFITCDGAAGSTYCTWVNKIEGRLVLRVDNAAQQVTSVQRISLGNVAAGRVFHAWRVGSDGSASAYATPSAVTALWVHVYKASDHWLPDGCEGAAGSTYCTFTNDAAKTLVLRVDNATQKVVEISGTF